MDDERAWFGPRRFGWGYRPVRWPGWLAVMLYGGAMIGLSALLPGTGPLFRVLVTVSGLALLVIASRTSRAE